MMPIINLYDRQKDMNRNFAGRGKFVHDKSILFQQVDVLIRTSYFGMEGT